MSIQNGQKKDDFDQSLQVNQGVQMNLKYGLKKYTRPETIGKKTIKDQAIIEAIDKNLVMKEEKGTEISVTREDQDQDPHKGVIMIMTAIMIVIMNVLDPKKNEICSQINSLLFSI